MRGITQQGDRASGPRTDRIGDLQRTGPAVAGVGLVEQRPHVRVPVLDQILEQREAGHRVAFQFAHVAGVLTGDQHDPAQVAAGVRLVTWQAVAAFPS
ncbi:MAG TPA: hypothetical protein VH333_02185 [Pseudonocardiaceae bacterium]|nr:hypothetical protein [Pseudonocardiaceae bacterium]